MSKGHHCEKRTVLQVDQLGPYGLVKNLSEVYADQVSKSASNRKKFLSKSFDVLLKKEKNTTEGLPSEWEDDDVLDAIKLDIFKRCKIKQIWTNDLCKNVIAKTEILRRNKDTEYFKNCVGPALRMLLCIEYYQQKVPTIQKKSDRFFNTDIISSYLDNIRSFLPKVETKVLTLPKLSCIPRSQSDGQLKYLPSNNRFDYIFQIGKETNDLDEGFVTPNDDHIEKSPCLEPQQLPTITEDHKEKFYWDYKIVSVPPSRNKPWEKFGTVGNLRKQRPFIEPNTVVRDWLRTAPIGVTYISRVQLLDDLLVLFVGIPSSTFLRDGSSFCLKEGIYTNDLTADAVIAISQKFIQAATGFIALMKVCESSSVRFGWEEDTISLVFKLALREYLNKYQRVIISAKEHFPLEETPYFKLMKTFYPFMEQVVHLKTILIKEPELKGVTLLKFLFDLMGSTSNTSIYRILSSLFLVPCIYYFKLIDEWIFLGKWHKDLPISASDMSCVKDRNSWLESHTPSANDPWLVPNRELAHCGKAVYLLSLSKNYDKFLCLLKSENRPKLKVCFNLEELSVLREECAKYYDEALKLFPVEEEEVIDSALCAHIAALKHTEEFETKRLQNKLKEFEKKKKELALREEDLVRSAQNKELRKLKEEAENVRVAKEYEQILHKEQQQEIEKSKVILGRYEKQLELEEKRIRRAEWNIKRHALNEKRKEFLSNDLQKETFILPLPIDENKKLPEELEKNDNAKPVPVSLNEKQHIDTNVELVSVDNEGAEEIPEKADCNKNKLQPIPESAVEDIKENITPLGQDSNASTVKDGEKKFTYNQDDQSDKVSEFEKNRAKAKHSDFMNENIQGIVKFDDKNEGEISELQVQVGENKFIHNLDDQSDKVSEFEQNRAKSKHSDFMNENIQGIVKFDDKNEGEISELQVQVGENKFIHNLDDQSDKVSEFEQNRAKSKHSDFMNENIQGIVAFDDKNEGEISELHDRDGENKFIYNRDDLSEKVSEFEQNRAKSKHSDFMNENVENIVGFDDKNEGELSELQKNRNKILGTYFDNREVAEMQASALKLAESVNIEEKLSDLEKNRMKVLSSNLDNDKGIKLHVWDEETQRNRKNMLDSHLPFAVEYEIEKANLKKKLEEKKQQEHNKMSNNKPNSKDSEKIAVDTQDCEEDKNNCEPKDSVDMNYKKPSWFQPKSREDNKMKHIFVNRSSSLVPNKDVDFTFLNKLVPQSLRTVIDIQTQLVNEALLRMFLSEFELLKVAQKLRECFFLHGEFGKRLTSSLSKAIETEDPSTLLTFYRLRNILAEASRGDIKEISFVVQDTPVAFDHSNSKVLLCLGLTYKCEWPLNLVFTDKAISKYNDIFVYMFALQRVSWHLDKVCHMLRFKSADLKGFQYTQIHLYRHVMSQFVGTLRSYIVTTVIENSWQEFVKDVSKVKHIDELYKRHAMYIKDINLKCFLDERSKKLMKEIEKLLHYILVFCRTLFYGEWNVKENEYTHSNFEKMRSTFSSFLSNARFVAKSVEKLVKVNYQKELENLNDFLTINSFYVS